MRRRALLGVGGSLLGTGCLRLTGGNSTPTETATDTPTETASATATPEPTDSPTEEPDTPTATEAFDYPSGVSEAGVTEAAILEHQSNLLETSATVNFSLVNENERTIRFDQSDRLVIENAGDFLRYTDGSRTFSRLTRYEQTVYGLVDDVRYDLSGERVTATRTLGGLIGGANWAATGVTTEDGRRFAQIEADTITDPQSLARSDTYFPENSTVSALSGDGLVTEDGTIIELTTTLGFEDGETEAVGVDIGEIGATSVEEPSWADTAREQAPRVTAQTVDDGQYIEVSHEGGQTVEPTTTVEVAFESGLYRARVSRFESGTTLYLYPTNEQQDGVTVLGLSEGSRPSNPPDASWSGDAFTKLRVDALSLFAETLSI